MRTLFLAAFGISFLGSLCLLQSSFADEPRSLDKEMLRLRVRQLDFQEPDVQKANVQYVFALAARYASAGDLHQALAFYRKGLTLDGWRWDQRLLFARLLYKMGSFKAALEEAKLVYLHSEDNTLVGEAEETLQTMGADLTQLKPRGAARLSQMKIVLVPIGKVDLRLLEEVREELQEKSGVIYSMAENPLDPGKADQTGADRDLERMFAFLKETIPQDRMDETLAEQKLKPEDLRTAKGMVHFLERMSANNSLSDNLPADMYRKLRELEQEDWFDAERLSRLLERYYPMGKTGARGYLGVVEAGLFRGGEALRGWHFPGQGYAVMTYWPFTSKGSGQEQNRPLLRSRFAKDALYYTFEILGIPDCLVPACARAASADSSRVDQKGADLCPQCRQMLENYFTGTPPDTFSPVRVVREAQRLMKEGRYGEALEAFERAHQLNPADLETRLLLARLYDDLQRPEEALALYRDLLKQHPDNSQVITDFLWFCADQTWWPYGDDETLILKEGLREAEKVLERWKEEPGFLEAYGWLAYKSGRPDQARHLLQQAAAYQPTAQTLYALSIVLSELKNKTQALQAYQEAIKHRQEGEPESIHEKGFRQLAETQMKGS